MNASLVRVSAKGAVKLITPNINADLRALPATVDPDLTDPAKAVALDKDKPIRRPTDPQLYELRIEVLPAERTAHPTLQAVVTGVAPQFVLLDASGRPMSSTTLDVAAEFGKSTKLLPNTLQYFLEAETFAVSALIPDNPPGLTVAFVDQGQAVASPIVLPLFVSDLVLLGDGETPSRLYIADIDDNQPTLLDVKAAASGAGVPVVTVPGSVCAGDTWLQDQFQLALTLDDSNAVQSIAVHLPRMRSNSQLTGSPDNLAAFVDNHFPSRTIGVLKDLWSTSIPVSVANTQGGPSTLRLNVRDSGVVLTVLMSVSLAWAQIDSAIAVLKGTSAPPAQPLKFFTKRDRLASELAVLKATPAKDVDQKRNKDTLTLSLDQKLGNINKAIPLLSHAVKLTINAQTVELSEQALNDLFDHLSDIHSSTNYGGNIEVAPPSPGAPLGTVVTGDVADSDLQKLLTRLGNQSFAQPWRTVNTSWLSVGHIDEIASFLAPVSPGVGSPLVLRASPKVAMALLDAAKKAQGAGVLVTRLFRGKKWRHEEDQSTSDPLLPPEAYRFLIAQYGKYDLSEFRTPTNYIPQGPSAYFDERKYLFNLPGNDVPRDYAAHMSVGEVLDISRETNRTIEDVFLGGKGKAAKQSDYSLLNGFPPAAFSELLQTGLDTVIAKEFPSAALIPFPVLFDSVQLFATSATEALTPDLVNLQQLGRTLLVPRPYGPRLRPSDALTLLRPLVDDNQILGLPPAVRQPFLKLMTTANLHSRQLDVTTHWTSPSQSCLRREPSSLNNKGYTDAVDTIDVIAELFRDGFDEFPNPDRDYTRNDTALTQTARDYFNKNIPLVRQRILTANPGVYSAAGYVSSNTWVRILIPENTVDLFEVYTQLLLEALGFTVKWIDSWFYHVHAGGVHCATNVLRTVTTADLTRRVAAAQKQ